MVENIANIHQGELKIGYLVIAYNEVETVVDCLGLDINSHKKRYLGSIVGVIRNNKFVDLIAERIFEILPTDERKQPILYAIGLDNELYADAIHSIEESYLDIPIIKDAVIDSEILKRIVKKLKEQKRGHILDADGLLHLQNKYEGIYLKFMTLFDSAGEFGLVVSKPESKNTIAAQMSSQQGNIIQLEKRKRHRYIK